MSRKMIRTDRLVVEQVSEQVFSLSEDIRYVAVYYRAKLGSVCKPNPRRSGSWDSDKYEELIVNPTLIMLLGQRGNIDCGGIRHVIVQYGDFTQFVHPIKGGHISVGFELKSEYTRFLPRITKLLSDKNLIVKNQKGSRRRKS